MGFWRLARLELREVLIATIDVSPCALKAISILVTLGEARALRTTSVPHLRKSCHSQLDVELDPIVMRLYAALE